MARERLAVDHDHNRISLSVLSHPLLVSPILCLLTHLPLMPEIRECFIHFKHAHHVLVETLGLGQGKKYKGKKHNWTLQDLFADATEEEARIKKSSKHQIGLTDKHGDGYLDVLDTSCTLMRGQINHQTRIWPGTEESPEQLDSLVLCGLSYTPRSLILKFKKLDLDPQELDLDLQKPDLGPQKPDLGPQEPDLGSQVSDLGSQESDHDSQEPDLKFKGLDLQVWCGSVPLCKYAESNTDIMANTLITPVL